VPSRLRLGVIADDMTGGTDAAAAMADAGLSVTQLIGPPDAHVDVPADCDAVVVSLKSRTAPTQQAVSETLASARWLVAHGVQRLFLKICSTFDSTADGNIGPAADALRSVLGVGVVPVTPANPQQGRTVNQGHLFVGHDLLENSSMRDHPLTPMRKSDVVALLQHQTASAVSLVSLADVQAGSAVLRDRLKELGASGVAYAVVDAVADRDLEIISRGSFEGNLWVGSASLLGALAAQVTFDDGAPPLPRTDFADEAPGATLCISGSASAATRNQVANFRKHGYSVRLDPLEAAADAGLPHRLAANLLSRLNDEPAALVYATADDDDVASARAALGPSAGDVTEAALASVAALCVAGGVRRVVVAGGETSGATLMALGVHSLRVGAPISPGVPWTLADLEPPVALALKSGNFGGPDFFVRASRAGR
jgi:uncharacterized protein YgbK (DUF1537 family)